MKWSIKKPDIKMSYKKFMEEHERLIRVLREGTREELEEEAEEQEEEMNKY